MRRGDPTPARLPAGGSRFELRDGWRLRRARNWYASGMSNSDAPRRGWAATTAAIVIGASLLWLGPVPTASAQLRPLVRDMLANLNAVNRIGEGLALEDWDRVEDAARELRGRAVSMRLLDLDAVYMDPAKDNVWDAFLFAQEKAAGEISLAVRNQDQRAALAATEMLLGNACVGCHTAFRDANGGGVRAAVHFMTNFLSAWRAINQGILLRDFDLVSLRARELETLSTVIASDEILEGAFRLGGSRQRRNFRTFLGAVTENAHAIDAAAQAEDLRTVLAASRSMWSDGCIGCHEKFRR